MSDFIKFVLKCILESTGMSESFNVFDFFIGGIKKVGKFFKEAFQ